MPQATLNYPAVIVAAAAAMVIGFVYYAKPVLGNVWAKLEGISDERMKKSAGPEMIWMVIVALVEAYVLAHFVDYTNATTAQEGLVTGLWIWLGFVATTILANHVFAGRPAKLYIIQVGYHLLTFAINGAILAAWQ